MTFLDDDNNNNNKQLLYAERVVFYNMHLLHCITLLKMWPVVTDVA